jgi:hypothetical protein
MDRPAKRVCWRCRRQLPWHEFAVDNSKASGHKSWCKRCDSEAALARYHRRRGELAPRVCSECDVELADRRRVVCSPSCRDRRYARLHPAEYAAKEARKLERRREARRRAREAPPSL